MSRVPLQRWRLLQNKLDLNKILIATDYIQESAEELGYEHSGTLGQLLDEVDALAMNTLEEEEEHG